jgi:uncharacterized membrane protein YphA (DoxX/SURF4 family)
MFPTGAPGVALLMLRLSVVGQLHLEAAEKLPTPSAAATFLALEVLCAALAAGIYTPVAVVVGVLGDAALWTHSMPDRWPLSALTVVNLIILFLIGPGAYSVDGRRYGRQVTIFTKSQ